MTRQEMLDKIYGEINFPYDDGDVVYSPVMIGDVLDWMEVNNIHEKLISQIPRGKTFTSPYEMLRVLWKTKRKPLDKQPDDCVQYVYSLI